MNLLIDIGNTHVKIALGRAGEIRRLHSLAVTNSEPLSFLLKTISGIDNCIVVRSGEYPVGWKEELISIFPEYIELKHTTSIPLEIIYETKESLGMDRIAAAVGANYLFPERNILVIDAGTAITVDFVSHEKKYLGGNIIPGMSVRFKSLHEHTDRLPLVEAKNEFKLLGNSTETGIRAGVLNGIVFELEGYIKALENKYPPLTVVMTGGDSEFFAKRLKSDIFVELNLIFAGLNRILEYNAHQGQNYSH